MPIARCQDRGRRGYRWGKRGKCYTGKGARRKAARQAAAIRASGWVENANPLRVDPSRTTTIRRRFLAELERRFQLIRQQVLQRVVRENAFGIANAVGQWRFLTSAKALAQFQAWLEHLAENQLLGQLDSHSEAEYWRKYVEDGWRQGAGRAYDDAKRQRQAMAAGDKDRAARHAGARDDFVKGALTRPESVEKVKLLASRVYTELDGITDEMSRRMTRVLADGLVRGDRPDAIGQELASAVGISERRAATIARTEIVRAHAEGQLDALERLGVSHVGVMVEWTTANDSLVCPDCGKMEAQVLSLKAAKGMIPLHPNCRCAWIPANVGEVRGKRKVVRKAKGKQARTKATLPPIQPPEYSNIEVLIEGPVGKRHPAIDCRIANMIPQALWAVLNVKCRAKVLAGRKNPKRATPEIQAAGEKNEQEAAKMLGGVAQVQGFPVDVITQTPKYEVGTEVKSFFEQEGMDAWPGKVGMRPPSRKKKENWGKGINPKNPQLQQRPLPKPGKPRPRRTNLIVIDERETWKGGKFKELYSGNRLYFKTGVGAYRVTTMVPVPNWKVMKLLARAQSDAEVAAIIKKYKLMDIAKKLAARWGR